MNSPSRTISRFSDHRPLLPPNGIFGNHILLKSVLWSAAPKSACSELLSLIEQVQSSKHQNGK
jgi:hypothetical protein